MNGLKVQGTFWQATQPVSGTFWQATQPVSLATNTPDVTDRAARLLGHVTVDNASIPVTDNAGSLTVDAPVGTPVWVRESDGAAAFVGQKTMASSKPVVIASDQSAIPASQSGTWTVAGGANVFHVDDNAASLTVDAPVGTPVFSRLSDGAAALIGQKVMASSLPVAISSDQSAVPVSGTVTSNQGTANATPWNENLAQVGGVAIATKAGGTFGQTGIPVWPNARQLDTYTVNAVAITTGALVAATRKDILSLEHAATATKTVRLRRLIVSATITTAGAAVGTIDLRLFTGTAASSAGTAITPAKHNQASGAAEVTAKSLPTIVAAGGPTLNSSTWAPAVAGPLWSQLVIYDWQENGETVPITLRSGVLESIVLAVQAVSTPVVLFYVMALLTEE